MKFSQHGLVKISVREWNFFPGMSKFMVAATLYTTQWDKLICRWSYTISKLQLLFHCLFSVIYTETVSYQVQNRICHRQNSLTNFTHLYTSINLKLNLERLEVVHDCVLRHFQQWDDGRFLRVLGDDDGWPDLAEGGPGLTKAQTLLLAIDQDVQGTLHKYSLAHIYWKCQMVYAKFFVVQQ